MFRELDAFRCCRPRSGVLLLRDLPVGTLPATPARPDVATGASPRTEALVLDVARRLGDPVGYLPEQGGVLVQNLLPTPDGADHQVSTSSTVTLAFHTETAFHPHLPRYLVLLCLRGDPAAVTTWCTVDDALAGLTPAEVEVLRQPRFRCGVDESFTDGRPAGLGPARPIVWGDPAAPSWTFDEDLMVGTDLVAQAALEHLAASVLDHQRGVVLAGGDLLVLDNELVVHGRSPFRARYDGTDRWLQRAFVIEDLAPSAPDRVGRIIDTDFAGGREGTREETWSLRPRFVADRIVELLRWPEHWVADELTLHPLHQDF